MKRILSQTKNRKIYIQTYSLHYVQVSRKHLTNLLRTLYNEGYDLDTIDTETTYNNLIFISFLNLKIYKS